MNQLFGWIPPSERSPEQESCHAAAMSAMPKLSLPATANEDEKIDLTDLWSHPDVLAALGSAFPGVYQQTGSCVGAAGGNMAFTVCCVDVIRLGDPERIIVPFWLLPYGRSRFYGGMKTPGEGSFGSTFAQAAKDDGFLDARQSGLPSFTNEQGLTWGRAAELSWSDGDAQQTMNLLPESRKRIIKTVSQVRTTDELAAGIRNYYPATNASMLIPNPNVESDGEAYGRVSRQGGHQTTFLGVWDHPTKGSRYFKYVNQWSTRWGKNGACWIPDRDAQSIINEGETFLFSQYDGYLAQPDWRKIA